jgi:hypothetical protein
MCIAALVGMSDYSRRSELLENVERFLAKPINLVSDTLNKFSLNP